MLADFNAMATDALSPCVAKAWAAIELTYFSWYSSSFIIKKVILFTLLTCNVYVIEFLHTCNYIYETNSQWPVLLRILTQV